MIKELQQQIQQQKQMLLKPINDVLDQLKAHYDYQTDIDLERKIIAIILQTKDQNGQVFGRVNIIRTLDEAVLNVESSVEYLTREKSVIGVAAKPMSFDIDFLAYVSFLASDILNNLEAEDTEQKER